MAICYSFAKAATWRERKHPVPKCNLMSHRGLERAVHAGGKAARKGRQHTAAERKCGRVSLLEKRKALGETCATEV